MAKRLFILRHAMALSGADADIDRALAPEGIEDAKALGKFMSEQGFAADIILCSPAKRTRQTLESLQQNLQTPKVLFPEILYNGGAGDYLYEIQRISDEHDNILMIAHNPSIYELVILLAAQGSDSLMHKLSQGYPPASLSVVECKCKKWEHIQPAENKLVYLGSKPNNSILKG